MVTSLKNTDLISLVDTFHLAFSDYELNMKMPHDYWTSRWASARIDYNLSFGYFENEKLVGFVLHGIDQWDGKKSFFNMGTGVIPTHRGQRIIKQIYEHAIPTMKAAGVEAGYLEVLMGNEKAIKSYESVGFTREKELSCYVGQSLKTDIDLSFQEIKDINPAKYEPYKNHYLSWEQTDAVVKINPNLFKCYELKNGDNIFGFAIIKPANGQVIQFGVRRDDWSKYGPSLFQKIFQRHPNYKVINLDIKDKALTAFFDDHGFKKLVGQWEMSLAIK